MLSCLHRIIKRLDEPLCLIFVLALFFIQAFHSAQQKTITFDEVIYIPAGYSIWTTGDYRMCPEHPPLVLRWAALPLLLRDVHHPADSHWVHTRRWQWGHQFLFESNDADSLILPARTMMILLGVSFAFAFFLLAKNLFGKVAAWAALTALVLCPNILAHTRLVTFDLPHTAFFMLYVFSWVKIRQTLSIQSVLLIVLAFAGLVLTKFTFALALPPTLLICTAIIFSSAPLPVHLHFRGRIFHRDLIHRKAKALAILLLVFLMGIMTIFAIWAAYGFHYQSFPADNPLYIGWKEFPIPRMIKSNLDGMERLRVLPLAFLTGMRDTFRKSDIEHSTFFLGEIRRQGHPWYFVLAIIWKTPLPTLLAALGGLWFYRKKDREKVPALFFLVPPLYWLFHFSFLTDFQLGLRYVLPIYPFMFLLAGIFVREIWTTRTGKVLAGIAIWSLVMSHALTAPDYLAYFNALTSPLDRTMLLGDSNLDWGEDLKPLARLQKEHQLPELDLAYFGTANPDYYGLKYRPLPVPVWHSPLSSRMPPLHESHPAEWVAISVTHLQGFLFQDWGFQPYLPFRNRVPEYRVGGSIYLYRIPPEMRELTYAELCENEYQKLIAQEPLEARHHLALGSLYLRWTERLPEALEELKKAIELDPLLVHAYYQLALAQSRMGKTEAAISTLNRGVAIDPKRPEFHYNLGVARQRLEQNTEALEAYQHTLRLNPNHFEAHYNVGCLQNEIHQPDTARWHFHRATQIRPESSDAWQQLAKTALMLGNASEARTALQRALELEPDNPQLKEVLQAVEYSLSESRNTILRQD